MEKKESLYWFANKNAKHKNGISYLHEIKVSAT